jgi:hypothetical protein
LFTAPEEQNTWFHLFYRWNVGKTEKLVERASSRRQDWRNWP